MSGQFYDRFLEAVWRIVCREWKGFLCGFAIATGVVWLLFGSTLKNHYDLGTYVGTYEVAIGQVVTVARSELKVTFERQLFYVQDQDTIWLYPLFEVSPYKSQFTAHRFSTFKIGRRLGIDGQYFYYTIELTELSYNDGDTVASFDVHRREYPGTIKSNP